MKILFIFLIIGLICSYALNYFNAKRNLKKKMQVFLVKESAGLFGDFTTWRNTSSDREVMSRNAEEALHRYLKRTHKFDNSFYVESSEEWGKYRVIPKAKPYERFIKYYR